MQPQNAAIAEGFSGMIRNVGAHALPPTASPDCSDVGLQGTQGLLTTRRKRLRAHLFSTNLNGAFFGVFPEGTYLYTSRTDGGIYYDVIPTTDNTEPPTTGWKVVVCFGPRWTVTQTGPGTTTGPTIALGPYDLSTFGRTMFTSVTGYVEEDEHDIVGAIDDATVKLQLLIGGVWTDYVISSFNAATGWSQTEASLVMSGSVTAGRTVTIVTSGAGSVTGNYTGEIDLVYGSPVSVENAA